MGKSNNNNTVNAVVGIIIFILGLFLIFSAFNSDFISDIVGVGLTKDGIQVINNSDFEIIGDTIPSRGENEEYIISGKVKQKKENSYDGIFITFTMYDANNKIVRSTSMNTSNYLGDNIWEFTAIGNDADKIVASYQLESVYGY